MALRALLDGADADLRYLAGVFSAGRIQVEQRGTTYWLSGTGLDNEQTALEVATKLLSVVNGLAIARNPDFRQVTLPGSFQEDEKPSFAQRRYTMEVRPDLSQTPWSPAPGQTAPPTPKPPAKTPT